MHPDLPDSAGSEPPVKLGKAASEAEVSPAEPSIAPGLAEPSEGPGPVADAVHQTQVRRLIVVGVAAVLLVAGAVVLAVLWASRTFFAPADDPLANQAFVDTGTTSAVVGDVTAAVKTVYSYDFNTLDANQAAAKAVITGKYLEDFDKVFAPVKQLAPQQQAAMTTTVAAVGVLQLHDDRARLLMMVDQNGTKGGSQPVAGATARLIVEAQLVDGHWKIAEVTPE
jgi:Mce-associated membrane protein